MLQFLRACRDFFVRVERKLDALIVEVQVRNAQHDHLAAQVNYLIAVERENRRKRQEQEDRERMSIIMPSSDETM